MFAIIRGHPTASAPKSGESRMDVLEEPLCRAPGISKSLAEPLLHSISRAATEPIAASTGRTRSEDDLAFQHHWLFDHRPQPNRYKRRDCHPETSGHGVVSQDSHVPLCGAPSAEVEHVYMGWQSDSKKSTSPYFRVDAKAPLQKCQQCVVLSETVNRLRETLSRSTKTSPTNSPNLGVGEFECQRSRKPVVAAGKPSVHPAASKVPEMRQINTLLPRNSADKQVGELSATRYEIPSSSSYQCLGNIDNIPTAPAQAKTQRRSVTFDNVPAVRPNLQTARPEYLPTPSNWYTESSCPMAPTQSSRTSRAVPQYPVPPRHTSYHAPGRNPPSQWTYTNGPSNVSKPQPPLPEAWASLVERKRMAAEAPPALEPLYAAIERGKRTHPAEFLRRPDVRPSLPDLRQAAIPAIFSAADAAASVQGPVTDLCNRPSTCHFARPATHEHERHERSVRSPEEQRRCLERLERASRPLHAWARHGGEELSGVDFARR